MAWAAFPAIPPAPPVNRAIGQRTGLRPVGADVGIRPYGAPSNRSVGRGAHTPPNQAVRAA